MSAPCEFCRLLSDPATPLVYEDAHTVAFFPLNPATEGHTLVIPRAHVGDLFELDLATAQQLTRTTLLVSRALRSVVSPEGMNLIHSTGSAASQTVPHLHVHLVPRWTGDRMKDIWPPGEAGDPVGEHIRFHRMRTELKRPGTPNIARHVIATGPRGGGRR